MQQLQSMESALKNESKSLRIGRIFVELFNPFDQIFFYSEAIVHDETSKFLRIMINPMNVAPNIENTELALWFIILCVLHIKFMYDQTSRNIEIAKAGGDGNCWKAPPRTGQ